MATGACSRRRQPARARHAAQRCPRARRWCVPPMGALAVTQKVAPLGMPLQRFGARRVDGGARFSIVERHVSARRRRHRCQVASSSRPAQFLDMSDAEKLSRRSFEPYRRRRRRRRRQRAARRLPARRGRRLRGHLFPQAAPPAAADARRRAARSVRGVSRSAAAVEVQRDAGASRPGSAPPKVDGAARDLRAGQRRGPASRTTPARSSRARPRRRWRMKEHRGEGCAARRPSCRWSAPTRRRHNGPRPLHVPALAAARQRRAGSLRPRRRQPRCHRRFAAR